ncbi:hypothetical protein [Dactylosporangium darangshiense]|uniref:hypothetical protein n=2 Tax=Dactylosporangium darangshiense TaxID=579108 RepID=UPI0031EDE61B
MNPFAPAGQPAPAPWQASGPPAQVPQQQWPVSGTSNAAPPQGAQQWPPAAAPDPATPMAGQWPPSTQQWPPAAAPDAAGVAQQWPGPGAPAGVTAPAWGMPPTSGAAVGSAVAPAPWQTDAAAPVLEAGPRRPIWIFPAVVALVLLMSGGTVAFVLRDRWLPGGTASPTTGPTAPTGAPATTGDDTRPTATATTQAVPTATTPAAPTLPASVGTVRLDPSLDPVQAPAVAAVFDTYFSAVNSRNAGAALAVMDPSGSINQNDSSAVRRFSDGISTSTDDDILLLTLGPDSSGKGLLQARVTFRSRQDPGKGPKGRESETCTRWDVTYSITKPGGGDYRIWGSTSAGNRPC